MPMCLPPRLGSRREGHFGVLVFFCISSSIFCVTISSDSGPLHLTNPPPNLQGRVLANKDTGNAPVTTHAPPDARPTDDLTEYPPNDQNRPRLYPLILEILVEGGEIVHSGNDARTVFAARNAGRAANHVYNVFITILKIIGLIQMYTGARVVPSVKSTAGVGPATLEAGMVPTLPSRPMHAHLAPQVAPFVAVNLYERLSRPKLENPIEFKIDVDSANEVSVPRRPYITNRANPSPETNPTK